jgi:hypothetical protein
MDREPRVAERIHQVMRQRLGREAVSPQGDLIAEEIDVPDDRPRTTEDRN